MWTTQEHLVNAAMWAVIGNYAIDSMAVQGVPRPVVLAGLAYIYSWLTDYFV
jgi:hypothetical protein